MATKDSKELKSDERYPLGDYSFRIERTSVPGSTNDKIEAICTDKDGKNARKSIQIPSSTQLDGWYVEANETEATVYVVVSGGQSPSGIPTTDLAYFEDWWISFGELRTTHELSSVVTYAGAPHRVICASSSPFSDHYIYRSHGSGDGIYYAEPYLKDGKTVYFCIQFYTDDVRPVPLTGATGEQLINFRDAAWSMVYEQGIEDGQYLVGRFAIDLEDAGGDGPGSDWIDPGDYDPDWEEGDPTHTLYVTVTGALSGRHNDPIVDQSYSYIPADKSTVKDYGCGGDGGHGGGGGAGASTVVIHKFATNQANSKEVTAIARRHGYGSGGGKGGKGGDGCILVYY